MFDKVNSRRLFHKQSVEQPADMINCTLIIIIGNEGDLGREVRDQHALSNHSDPGDTTDARWSHCSYLPVGRSPTTLHTGYMY